MNCRNQLFVAGGNGSEFSSMAYFTQYTGIIVVGIIDNQSFYLFCEVILLINITIFFLNKFIFSPF